MEIAGYTEITDKLCTYINNRITAKPDETNTEVPLCVLFV